MASIFFMDSPLSCLRHCRATPAACAVTQEIRQSGQSEARHDRHDRRAGLQQRAPNHQARAREIFPAHLTTAINVNRKVTSARNDRVGARSGLFQVGF